MKRPKETSKKRPPTAKRAKLSAAGIQQESPRSYKLKRPIETSKKKQPATKQFKPPMAEKMLSVDRSPLLRRSPLVRNPELRLVVSPVVIAQSPRSSPPSPPLPVERSSSPSPLPGNYCLCAHFFNAIVYRPFSVFICLMRTNISFTPMLQVSLLHKGNYGG